MARAAIVLVLLAATACSGDDATTVTTATSSSSPPSASAVRPPSSDPVDTSLVWHDEGPGVQTATLEVPVDYDDPGGAQFELFVARHLATDQAHRVGTLLVNPGGPGVGGSDFATYASVAFGAPLLDRFDIVGWDPRGTGRSTPAVDCVDDDDAVFAGDVAASDDVERAALVEQSRRLAAGCVERSAAILGYVGTNDSARDMDAIRRALGEDTVSYFGFSYGSELGATWATLFPTTVRAAVLDGAVDPTKSVVDLAIDQAAGFEAGLTTFLTTCGSDPTCAFYNGGQPAAAFDALLAGLDATPLASPAGRPAVDRGMALTAATEALYATDTWDQLAGALAQAQRGDGSGLLLLWDAYYRREPDGTWSNAAEAMRAITCMDHVERPTVAATDAEVARYTAAAPRMGLRTARSYACSFFPAAVDPRVPITGAGAPPIVVLGTTGDPATPFAGSQAMAAALAHGHLVVVDANGHTGYGADSCVDAMVHDYLIDLAIPNGGSSCP